MKIIGALMICLAASLWGLDGVVLTPRLHGIPVSFAVFLFHIVPFILMQPFLYRSYEKICHLSSRGYAILFMVSVTGGFLGTYSIVRALFMVNFNQLSVVVLLQKLQPLFAITLAAWLLKERITSRFLALAATAMVGAYFLTFGARLPDVSGSIALPWAALWSVLAAFCFGSATVLGKMLLADLDFKQATFARYGMTSLIAFGFLLISGTGLPFASITRVQWGIIVLIGLTTGSGAIFLYYSGLRYVTASVSTICELCLPLSAFLLDRLVNKTVLDPVQWLGAVVLLVSITAVSLSMREK